MNIAESEIACQMIANQAMQGQKQKSIFIIDSYLTPMIRGI